MTGIPRRRAARPNFRLIVGIINGQRRVWAVGVQQGLQAPEQMDGRGRCLDNVFVERLWPVKHEYQCLHAFQGGQELRTELSAWLNWYNRRCPHQGLGYQTPGEVYAMQNERIPLVA